MLRLLLVFASVFTCTWSIYSSSSGVTELTTSNFDDLVTNKHQIWFIHFYTRKCANCDDFATAFQKGTAVLEGIVNFGGVNIEEEPALRKRFGIGGDSKLKIFNAYKTPLDYDEAPILKNVVDVAVHSVLSKIDNQNTDKSKKYAEGRKKKAGDGSGSSTNAIVTLTDSNFDQVVIQSEDVWMVEFFQPWCKYCQLLAPEWAKAAKELHGKVKFGALDGSTNNKKLMEYNIQGYPTIKFWAAGKKTPHNFINYDGGRSAHDIVAWVLDKYEHNLPAPEITQIVNSATFKKYCSAKRLCVVSFLPHILDCDAKCRNTYITLLKTISEQYKKNQWGWVWSEARAQLELEQTLDVGNFGYPAIVVLNSEKQKYVLMRGSFSEAGIGEFLASLTFGRVHSDVLQGQLPDIKTVDPWDGKDGVLEVEDEYSYEDEKDEL